jgi:predicted house-cleaning noncanonical NTP pyrophosphatase (MazG superfamily)
VEELADLYEVVRTLAIIFGHEFDEVVHVAAQKRATHGVLLDGVFLLKTS